jgi:lipopolysaccharide transport system permease protein
MILLMGGYRFLPDWHILLLPLFVLFAFVAGIGPSLWITALNVKYRNFRFIIPFIAQFGLYVSAVGFSSSIVPQQWRLAYSLHPMVGVIDGFRWCILGGQGGLYLPDMAVSAGDAAFFLWFGIRRFRKIEKSFADLI